MRKQNHSRRIRELYDGPPRFSLLDMKVIPPYKGPKRAFYDLVREVENTVHLFTKDSWNIAIELLADHLGLMTDPWKYSVPEFKWHGPVSKPNYCGFSEVKQRIQGTGLIEAYIEQAKAEPWDYIGDLFIEEELAGKADRLAQVLTPRNVIEMMVQMTLGTGLPKPYSFEKPDFATRVWLTEELERYNTKLAGLSINLQAESCRLHTVAKMRPILEKYDPEPVTDLDPCVGTGRFLIVASQMYPKAPLILYGIEIDVSLYRACLVNMAMFSSHPYSILRGNSLMLKDSVWGLGNQWDPPDLSPYYSKPPPPKPIDSKHFDLKYFSNLPEEDKV